jgi:hypothetical protein
VEYILFLFSWHFFSLSSRLLDGYDTAPRWPVAGRNDAVAVLNAQAPDQQEEQHDRPG